jgi:hypothetical protein
MKDNLELTPMLADLMERLREERSRRQDELATSERSLQSLRAATQRLETLVSSTQQGLAGLLERETVTLTAARRQCGTKRPRSSTSVARDPMAGPSPAGGGDTARGRLRAALEPARGRASSEGHIATRQASPTHREVTPMTPRERFIAAASALRQSIDDSVHASTTRLRDAATSALARHAPTTASLLQRLPGPGRIRDLSEAPEKAVVAGTAAAVSRVVPAAAPIVEVAARAIEKQIDLTQVPDDGGRSR